jgi:Ser/Thr protein kinase RdoA (MazF antagonist)
LSYSVYPGVMPAQAYCVSELVVTLASRRGAVRSESRSGTRLMLARVLRAGSRMRVVRRSVFGVIERPPAPSFDATLARMYRRRGVDTLPAHLEEVLGIRVTKMRELDVGVFRVDRRPGAPVVARLFAARRGHAAVGGDLAVLEQLEAAEFPAERPFGSEAVSVHDGQPVLVTQFVRGVPRSGRPAGHPVVALGALVGRLHGLVPTGAADRPAGALHHYAEGTPADELRVAQGWLRDIEARVAVEDRDQLEVLGRALGEADDSAGLPQTFVHPDPVPKNAVFTGDGPVLVDWAGAGRGPRLASLALVLRSSWAGPPFMRGYSQSVEFDGEERRRAPEVLMTRALIDITFQVCREPATVRHQVKRLPAVRKRIGALAAAVLATA